MVKKDAFSQEFSILGRQRDEIPAYLQAFWYTGRLSTNVASQLHI